MTLGLHKGFNVSFTIYIRPFFIDYHFSWSFCILLVSTYYPDPNTTVIPWYKMMADIRLVGIAGLRTYFT